MNVDSRGVMRGCCNFPGCSCSCYAVSNTGGMKCDKCGHPPGRHAKSSMTMPIVQSVSDESASNSEDDNEPSPQPVSMINISSPFSQASLKHQSLPISLSPRSRPKDAWAAAVQPPPSTKKQSLHPVPTCIYPNCDKEAFFNLNTREESEYCNEHVSTGHFVVSPEDLDLSTRFSGNMFVTDGSSDVPMQLSSMPHALAMEQSIDLPLQASLFPQHAPMQTLPPHTMQAQPMFHPSQSTPNFALQPRLSPTQSLPSEMSLAGMIQPPPPVPIPAPIPAPVPDHMCCKLPGCKRKRYQEPDGKIHEFCRRSHAIEFAKRNQAAVSPDMRCKTQSCSRPRRKREDGNGYYDYCGKSCRDGAIVTSDSGELCSLPGCNRPRYVDPGNGRVHNYCGRTHANEALTKGIAPQVCTLKLLGPSDPQLAQVQAHFQREWVKGSCPPITCVFQVTNSQLEKRWKTYKEKKLPSGNQISERHFHGTKLTCDIVNSGTVCNNNECGICGICKYGMDRNAIRKNINFQRFGHGFYFAPHSSKCHDYTQGVNTHRAMLLVDILPGKKHIILTTLQKLTGPPDGCHSVFGKAGRDLNYPEIVVYNADCVMPRYIVVYVLNGVHKIAK